MATLNTLYQTQEQLNPATQPVATPTMTATTTSVPLPNPMTLPINGQDFVATATPGAGGIQFSPASVVGGLQAQLGYTPTQSGTQLVQGINQAMATPNLPGAATTTLDNLNQILGSGSSYINNAQRRGLEQAGARGMLNSSIAGGAATRAAIESSMPILNEAMGLTRQREGQDFQANQLSRQQAFGLESDRDQQAFQSARDRLSQAMQLQGQREQQAFQGQESALSRTQQVNNQLLESQLRTGERLEQGQIENWLASESFTRQFNGALSMLPVQSAMDLNRLITQYSMSDPELYTPQVVSGMSEFFNKNMLAIMQQYLGTGG